MKRVLRNMLVIFIGLVCMTASVTANDNPNLNPMLPGSEGEGVVEAVYGDGTISINDTRLLFSPVAKMRTMDDKALFLNDLKPGDWVLFDLDDDMRITWLMKLN